VDADPKTRDLLDHVLARYPSPIAETTRKWRYANDDSRLNEGLFLAKALAVSLGTISITWCRSIATEPPGVRRWHESLKKRSPTLGHWVRAARDGAKLALEAGIPVAGFEQALGSEHSLLWSDLQAIVSWRNKYGGGGGGGIRAATIAQVEEFEQLLVSALGHSGFLADMVFALIESSEPQRGSDQYLIKFKRLIGDHPVLAPDKPFEHLKPFYPRSIYVLLGPGKDLDLTPLWTVQPCKHCRQLEASYLMRAKATAFEYASFSNNESFVDKKLPRDIPWSQSEGLATSGQFPKALPPSMLIQPERLRTTRSLPPNRINLPHLYRQTQSAMLQALHVHADTGHTGWDHHLELPRVSAVGTALGLRIMRMVSDDASQFRSGELIETLWSLRLSDGCWRYRSQAPVGRPEATAAVLLTLCQFGEQGRVAKRKVLEAFERILEPYRDEVLWNSVFSLSTVAPALSTAASHSHILGELIDILWSAAHYNERDGTLCWSRLTRLHPGHRDAPPSAPHTARAALALLHCFQATDGKLGASPEDLQPAATWLLQHPDWRNTVEIIRRPFGESRAEEPLIRHFTPAWTVRALLELDVDPMNARIVSTISELYGSHAGGVWNWDGVQRPVWATLDALRALETYALRASPLGPDAHATPLEESP
jgi:hypothetical protein